MKNNVFSLKKYSLSIIFVFLFYSCLLYGKETIITFMDLPEKSQTYIKTHFAEAASIKIKKSQNGLSLKYEVKLNNMIELEFNSKGEITCVEGHIPLPDSVIPQNILEYVKKNYNDKYITEWKIKKRIQEVELSNGLELQFDLKGNFLRIDR